MEFPNIAFEMEGSERGQARSPDNELRLDRGVQITWLDQQEVVRRRGRAMRSAWWTPEPLPSREPDVS